MIHCHQLDTVFCCADIEFSQFPVAVVECDDALFAEAPARWVSDKRGRFQQPVNWLRLPETFRQGELTLPAASCRHGSGRN